ncbi:hypothetical protein [Sedimenticola sp.]|uniref:hypothetical protein n=1 Tax=Sedimenticola sp. TaxID=1940285 RepID=UPI003D148512
MESIEKAQEVILKEITSDNSDVRSEYLEMFGKEIESFSNSMAQAYIKWKEFDNEINGDERRAMVSAVVYSAISLNIASLSVFLSGHTVASGNLMRQVCESIALALLCSGKTLNVLDRYRDDKYSTTVAVRDVIRHAKALSLHGDALEVLKNSQEFYHKYSHVTNMTIAIGMSFSQKGALYVGASFDEGKIDIYKKEVAGRVSLAGVFTNFVEGVSSNVSKW